MARPVTLTIQTNTRLARLWIALIRLAVPVIGADRAIALAEYGVRRLVLAKFDSGPWRRLDLVDVVDPLTGRRG